jgi:transcriptional regulator with XRE-family HTH domain
LREERVLSQRELAQLAGVRQGTIASLELGRNAPHAATIRKLAKALGVSPRELLSDG